MTYDWGIVSDPNIQGIIDSVLDAVEDTTVIDRDDLFQLCVIQTATVDGPLYEAATAGEYGLYTFRLRQRVMGFLRTERRRSDKQDPLAGDYSSGDGYYEPVLDLDSGKDYTGDIVRAVLPALWDESYAMRLDTNPLAPDGNMPRGKGGSVSGPAHWDFIVDVSRAWEDAGLSTREKAAIFLTVGLELPLREAGGFMGYSHVAVQGFARDGMCKLVSFLNGENYVDA